MKLFLINLVFVLFLIPIFSYGGGDGGWVSSGGELFRDAHNPWFVKNTKTVYYCIRIDQSTITAELNEIKSAVKDSIQYWTSELSRVDDGTIEGRFNLGSQSFEEVTCDDTKLDLRILFGFGTLNTKELEFLKDPTKYIGITVRTEYDIENLKGKGFIYISSDIGEKAYDNPGTLIEKAWGRPKILRYALMHEFGHIFGLPHMGTGLMAEVFLNQILNKNIVGIFEAAPVETFILPPNLISSCDEFPYMLKKEFFGIPSDHKCIQVKQMAPLGVEISSRKDEKSEFLVIGTIKNLNFEISDFSGRPSSILQLTDKQKVFSPAETAFRSFMLGPILNELGMKGTFVPVKPGPPKSVYLKITPTSFHVIGFHANKVEPIFSYNSPLGIKLLMSPKPLGVIHEYNNK